ncbi:hypothetical protein [Ornithinimicrobium sp. Y1694]|uniref:hypothetical protein n=1 Tax=Ornithinimicrobium sp. Y1694 TaxID=3418590 RepID=UPI003CF5249E
MSDPTDLPFQDPEQAAARGASSSQGQAAEDPVAAEPEVDADALLPPSETETDLLAARVEGPEDHEGMTELWRATMDLPHWWFIAVGDEGMESPAAAVIDDHLMLMTFTNAERARHFAVQNGMIGADEHLQAIALPPQEIVDTADAYASADIAGLMFDPHLSGYFIPSTQLPVMWEAIRSQDEARADEARADEDEQGTHEPTSS